MLARGQRLRHERDILRVYKQGRYGGAADLHIKALRSGLPGNRIAVVVSRKVHKHAVVRNRIRRRTFGQLEQLWNQLMAGYDVVVTARHDVSATDTAELHRQLVAALRQAGVLNQTKETDV